MALVDIMRHGKSEHARISAAVHLMDRGHGRIPQGSWSAPENHLDHVYRTVEEIQEELRRQRLPENLIGNITSKIEAENRGNGQNSENGQPLPVAEEQWENDYEDS